MAMTLCFESLIAKHAGDLASVTGDEPATTVDGFIDQIDAAHSNIDACHIPGADDLDEAARYLRDAQRAEGLTQGVLLEKAADLLRHTACMAAEYRDMT